MSIINRYIIGEVIKQFMILMGTLVSIYYVVDFFEKIDNFIGSRIAASRIVTYFAYKLPFISAQMIPICLLLAVIVTFGLMNRHNELVAFRSNGIGIFHLLKPVLMISAVFVVILFMLSEVVVPVTVSKTNRIWLEEVKKKSVNTSRSRNIWIREKQRIIHIEYYNPAKKAVNGFVVYEFDPDFNLVRRLDAPKGVFKPPNWVMLDAMEQKYNSKTEMYDVLSHDEVIISIDLKPEDLTRVVKGSEEMGFIELMRYIRQVESEGYDVTPYRVDLYGKAAFPFVCLLMGLLGTGIAAKIRSKDSLAFVVAAAIGLAFLYWTAYGLFISLGYGEVLPPLVAAWATNAIFFFLSIYLLVIAI
ncbi:MAG: LPS export ABC transporter permease LptG [Deltaproteobacteria bacterium]|nr:MAG: LPS export ABC transporter permease LptG [Deltaproteobacteria bacterium]RUA03125.1 MAG: LPS export ABC transporter permease LptG [Deltaproteobacteria bacterium]